MKEKQNNILVLHDFFLYRGGAERYNLMLADTLGADIAASFWSNEALGMDIPPGIGKRISFARESVGWGIPGMRQLYLAYKFRFSTSFVQNYDTVIFSNDAIASVGNAGKNAKKIFFAHSLPRYLFDRREEYYQKVPLSLRVAYVIFRYFLERLFFRDLNRVDEIWTNSVQLSEQIRQYTGRESIVINPCVDTDVFSPDVLPHKESYPYFLSFSKLSYFKRIDRVIDAFGQMPDHHLILIYGEKDPDKDELLQRASPYQNIHPVRLGNNSELPNYIRGAIATIFIPQNEDFGMVAIESMACGTPVIGVDEGGLRETVMSGKTGILIPEGAPIDELKKAIKMMSTQAIEFREDARKRGGDFRIKAFQERVQNMLSSSRNKKNQ